jgi:NAD-dependent dihydropyrimidine dehydrogenase PreA subunit
MPFAVVISQGQSANPLKRKLEEDLVASLLGLRGIEVLVVPHLYDLKPGGTGMLCLQGVPGNMIVVSWLFPRAAFWTLDRNGIRGRFGTTLLVGEEEPADEDNDEESAESETNDDKQRVADARPMPNRSIHCLDLRVSDDPRRYVAEVMRIVAEASVQTVDLLSSIGGPIKLEAPTPAIAATETAPVEPTRIAEEPARRWYPVIDYSRCTNCMECIDFCLFGVYGVDRAETILVEQPDNCRKGCPACSRVCPENAIIFPQHKSPAIAGSPDGEAGGLRIDLSKLFGAPDGLHVAVLERDVELVAAGRDAVGETVGIPRRRTEEASRPKDELDALIDELDGFA